MTARAAWVLHIMLCAGAASAQPLFTDAFPPQEFADRRAHVMAAIGDGVALLQGATEYPAYVRFRQSNHFFYLTGVEVPRALVIIDGRARTTTLYLPPHNPRLERSEGPALAPGDEAERLTGIPTVRPRETFTDDLLGVIEAGRTVYTPFRPETLAAVRPRTPWPMRPPRREIRGTADAHVRKCSSSAFTHTSRLSRSGTSTRYSIGCG